MSVILNSVCVKYQASETGIGSLTWQVSCYGGPLLLLDSPRVHIHIIVDFGGQTKRSTKDNLPEDLIMGYEIRTINPYDNKNAKKNMYNIMPAACHRVI